MAQTGAREGGTPWVPATMRAPRSALLGLAAAAQRSGHTPTGRHCRGWHCLQCTGGWREMENSKCFASRGLRCWYPRMLREWGAGRQGTWDVFQTSNDGIGCSTCARARQIRIPCRIPSDLFSPTPHSVTKDANLGASFPVNRTREQARAAQSERKRAMRIHRTFRLGVAGSMHSAPAAVATRQIALYGHAQGFRDVLTRTFFSTNPRLL